MAAESSNGKELQRGTLPGQRPEALAGLRGLTLAGQHPMVGCLLGRLEMSIPSLALRAAAPCDCTLDLACHQSWTCQASCHRPLLCAALPRLEVEALVRSRFLRLLPLQRFALVSPGRLVRVPLRVTWTNLSFRFPHHPHRICGLRSHCHRFPVAS